MFQKLALVLSLACLPFLGGYAQDSKESPADETTAQVPVLTDFHEVIFKIWHTAWPEKNVAMLAELLPEVRNFSDSLVKVQLPGILRDKETLWNENTAKLREIVSSYEKAAAPVDSQNLLAAAEQLHAQYEKLVRVIRPALKELESFHQVLYMLYHHYLPQNDQEKIVSSVKALKEKMEALDKATLPDRLKKKEAAFLEARTKLSQSVGSLDPGMAAKDQGEFASQVEAMHTDYQALEKVFE